LKVVLSMTLEDWAPDVRDYVKDCLNWFDLRRYDEQAWHWTAEQWRIAVGKRQLLYNQYVKPFFAKLHPDRHYVQKKAREVVNTFPVFDYVMDDSIEWVIGFGRDRVYREELFEAAPLISEEGPYHEGHDKLTLAGSSLITAINVNLNASDEALIYAFKQYLARARDRFNYPEPKPRPRQQGKSPRLYLDGSVFQNWASWRLLAYLDLNAWRIIQGYCSLTAMEWASLLYPERSPQLKENPKGGNWRKNEHQAEAEWMLTYDAISLLDTIVQVYPNCKAVMIPKTKIPQER
jgi:hypothetical protein